MNRLQRYEQHKSTMPHGQRIDPLTMPVTGEAPQNRLNNGLLLTGTPGQAYVEHRCIPIQIAHEAGVRFDPDWNGRPAVIAPMFDLYHALCSVHGRYLSQAGNEDKMFTIGPGGGIFSVLGGYQVEPVIFVEGLFDALSLAVCGYSSIATVGRLAPWLPEVCRDKLVVLAFDANRPGEAAVEFYKKFLSGAKIHRLTPPGHTKDWNSALMKRGAIMVAHWLEYHLYCITR
ncbi:toprim domain-containing protein [Chitinophagaceae bacterium 26-R-25]|nr:toprim domain-containing protein [Chitinophagaceae bacterium 26-R-25]